MFLDSTIWDTAVAVVDTISVIDPVIDIPADPVAPVEDTGGLGSFILDWWAELLIGFMAFVKVIVNLTPTEKDNQIFGWIDSLINMIVTDRKKG
jgi:hypothetical protein